MAKDVSEKPRSDLDCALLDAFGSESVECLCPIVEIACTTGQVSDTQMRTIADDLHAQVSRKLLDTPEGKIGMGATIWGKHRDDCPVLTSRRNQ